MIMKNMIKHNKTDKEILNQWHDDHSNWRFGIFYYRFR